MSGFPKYIKNISKHMIYYRRELHISNYAFIFRTLMYFGGLIWRGTMNNSSHHHSIFKVNELSNSVKSGKHLAKAFFMQCNHDMCKIRVEELMSKSNNQ